MTQTQQRTEGGTAPDNSLGIGGEPTLLVVVKGVHWWLWLIPPIVLVGWVVWANSMGFPRMFSDWLEKAAIPLLSVATALFAVRTLVTRNPLHLLVTFLAGDLLCREIHFAGTTAGVFVVFGLLVAWAVLWRRQILRAAMDRRFLSWLLAALWAYLLSQLVAKRIFSARHLGWVPNEDFIHTSLEEVVETTAHLMFIVAALVGSWARWPRPNDKTQQPG